MTTEPKPRNTVRNDSQSAFVPIPGFEMIGASMATAGQAYFDAIGKCQSEICEFMTRRLTVDLNHGQNLTKCGDLGQVVAAQQAWLQQAFEDFAAESQRLANLGACAANGWKTDV